MYLYVLFSLWYVIYFMCFFITLRIDLQTVFGGLATVPFVRDWYLRCIQRGASKKATTICVITESA